MEKHQSRIAKQDLNLSGRDIVNYVKINDMEINEQYTQKKEDGNIILKIGNSDEIVSGEKEYIIKKHCRMYSYPTVFSIKLYSFFN